MRNEDLFSVVTLVVHKLEYSDESTAACCEHSSIISFPARRTNKMRLGLLMSGDMCTLSTVSKIRNTS